MLKEVPTLYPTEEQFEDPIAYLSTPEVASLGAKYGMVKLVSPDTFKPPLSINKNRFRFNPRIQNLNELNLISRCRSFFYKQLLNFNKMNKLLLPKDSFELINGFKFYYYDFFINIIKYYQADNTSKIPDISYILNDEKLWAHLSKVYSNIDLEIVKAIYLDKLYKYFNYLSLNPDFTLTIDNKASLLQPEFDHDDTDCIICGTSDDPENTLLCDSCNKPYHIYCLKPKLKEIPHGEWFCESCILGNGSYGFKDSNFNYSLNDFEQLCNEFDKSHFKVKPDIDQLELIFWSLVENENDLKVNYGADIHNLQNGQISGFPTIDYIPLNLKPDKDSYNHYVNHPMNLNNLPFDKNSLLSYLNVDITGMTIPWIYIGSTFSTFCWHVEDQWTLSANYQHFGDIKKWYSIPSSSAAKFEDFMKNLCPDLFMKQPDILHQLITLISPYKLTENGIEVFTANQKPGEFIITYPRVYHAGFNSGFNFNEAVNFTMTNWLDFGICSSFNYKKINKSSVFDVWDLIINILKKDESEKIDLDLIKECLKNLKIKLNDEYSLFTTVKEEIKAKPKSIQIKNEDGLICSKCKGFCTFFYVQHFKLEINKFKIDYLLTPESSPEENQRRSKRIKINQKNDSYENELLCIDDYLKLNNKNDLDELYIIKDINEIKEMVKRLDEKYGNI